MIFNYFEFELLLDWQIFSGQSTVAPLDKEFQNLKLSHFNWRNRPKNRKITF